jgi:hypothetical protein
MVSIYRSEALGIPHVLSAPKVQIGPQLPSDFHADEHPVKKEEGADLSEGEIEIDRSIYSNGIGDVRGYYQDGAYMAVPDITENNDGEVNDSHDSGDDEDEAERKLHQAYFSSLLDKYTNLRIVLNSTPPKNALSRLSPSQRVHAEPFGARSNTNAVWSRLLRNTDPHPLQLALMSKDSILRVLRVLLGGKFLRSGHTVDERTSRWLWALLARLPERGELNYAEVGWIRDLGRRAVLLGRSLAEMAALRDELADGGLGVHEGVDGSSSDEDVVAGDDPDIFEGAVSPSANTGSVPDAPDPDEAPKLVPSHEEGEIADDDEDVAMDIADDSSVEEGEAADDDDDDEAKLEERRRRLLEQLDASTAEDEQLRAEEMARERARMNMRATLCMVLTVAGEFYGQRDLLEFREPFVGM